MHLIKKHQINVYDIPISLVTKQYLEYLDLLQELNLDVASEFLVMAATLIHIKSKMLLPRPETAAGDPGEEEDPRDALVRRLLEHQKFKAAAELLHEKETLRSAQWARPDARIEELAGDDYEPEIEVDLFSLLSAFKQVLERARERPPIALPAEQISIETRIEQLLGRLSETDACGFEDLFDDIATRTDMIVTFLAILEMIRLKLVRVFQTGGRGAIRIYKRARPSDAPHPIHDPEDSYKAHHPPRAEDRDGEGMSDDAPTPDEMLAEDAPPKMELSQLKAVIEALMFASPEPITPRMLNRLLNDEPKEDVQAALKALQADYVDRGGLHIAEVAGGFQITTRPEYHEWVGRLFRERSAHKLSVAVARNPVGDRLQAAGDRRRNRRDPQRQHVRRADDAARAAPDQDRRPQERHRPAVPLRHHEGIPDPLRPQRPQRPAEDRRHGPAARLRTVAAADGAVRAGRNVAARRGRRARRINQETRYLQGAGRRRDARGRIARAATT